MCVVNAERPQRSRTPVLHFRWHLTLFVPILVSNCIWLLPVAQVKCTQCVILQIVVGFACVWNVTNADYLVLHLLCFLGGRDQPALGRIQDTSYLNEDWFTQNLQQQTRMLNSQRTMSEQHDQQGGTGLFFRRHIHVSTHATIFSQTWAGRWSTIYIMT